jgi:hypothetical protein
MSLQSWADQAGRRPDGPRCPTCGSLEMHPTEDALLVRFYKVFDRDGSWSQCLVCAGYYNPKTLEVNPSIGKDKYGRDIPQGYDENKGWFVS